MLFCKKIFFRQFIIAVFFVLIGSAAPVSFASETDGTIDAMQRYAWGDHIGWVDFGTIGGGVHVTDSALTGYAWSQNYGWINLSPSQSGVLNDGSGILSGYAWGESLGWINFNGVSITNGLFAGTAVISSTPLGAITFNCANCGVVTDWRSLAIRNSHVGPSGGGGGGTGGGGGGGGYTGSSTPTSTSPLQPAVSPILPPYNPAPSHIPPRPPRPGTGSVTPPVTSPTSSPALPLEEPPPPDIGAPEETPFSLRGFWNLISGNELETFIHTQLPVNQNEPPAPQFFNINWRIVLWVILFFLFVYMVMRAVKLRREYKSSA